MPAAAIIVVVAVETGVAATVGAAIASTVVAGTVSTAVATAVGAGAISAGITAAQGGSVSDVLKSAVIGGVSAGVGASVGSSVASAVSESAAAAGYTSIASTLGTIAGQTVGGGVQSAITAAAYGKDPVDALIKGGLTAGLTSGVMQAVNLGTSKIDGFNELPTAVQRATKSALAAGALGKDPEKAALNSFLSSASKYVGSQLKDYGNELKTAYDTATAKGIALQDNAKRQEEIVAQYGKTADALNADYAKVQTLTKEANDAIAAFENGGKTQELADVANAKVKVANDFIAEYDNKYASGKATLDSLVTELDGLKATLPTLDKEFADSKLALEDTTKLFQTQEAQNAEILAKTVKDVEVANTTLQNELGVDLSEDLIQQFVESGDVNTAATNYVQTTNQASQDLGFENYKDQTAAAENDFTPEEAAQWNEYKDTSGVVAGLAPGVETTGLGGQTDIANLFEPTAFEAPESFGDLTQAPTTEDFYTPTAPLEEELPTGVQEEPFTYTAEQLYQDVAPSVDQFDLASYFPDTYETPIAPAIETPTAEPATDITDLFGESATQPTEIAQTELAPAESDAIARLIDDYYKESTLPTEGVQLASYSPSGTMTDVGGLPGLITQPQPTAEIAPEDQLISTEPSAEPTTDLTALTPGSATYSALTGTDPTKTITGSVLGEDTGDVRGGIESSALYSGTEEELAPSDLISGKYFTETPEGKALEDVGLTGETFEPITLASATSATPTKSDVLLRSDETTLPTSSEASQTATALKGTTMDDTYDEYAGYPEGGFFGLPEGAEPETIISEPEGQPQLLNDVVTIGSDIYRINPDGSAVGTNTETGEQFNVTAAQLQAMLGDQGFGPGEAGDLRGMPTYKPGTFGGQGMGSKIANAITNQFQKDPLKFLTALGGAAAGAASTRKGITPRGLQSLQGLQGIAGGGAGRYQTGAVGTKGRGGVRYFERRAEGGPIGYAQGGLGYLKTAHDGMADQIDATIDNKRPAKLSGGEFVIPADVVSHLGNGNSEAGAKQLYDLMERVRQARTGTPKQGKQINPKKYLPK